MSDGLKNFELYKLSFHTGFHVLFCTSECGEKWKRIKVHIKIFKTLNNTLEQRFLITDGFACPYLHSHPRDIWQFLETFLVVTSVRGVLPLAPSG